MGINGGIYESKVSRALVWRDCPGDSAAHSPTAQVLQAASSRGPWEGQGEANSLK